MAILFTMDLGLRLGLRICIVAFFGVGALVSVWFALWVSYTPNKKSNRPSLKEDVYRQAKPAREEPPPSLLKEERKEKANPQPSALRKAIELKGEKRENADPQPDALKKQIEPPPLPLKEEEKKMANPQPSALRNQLEREIEEGFEELKYTVVKARGSITWQVIGLSVLVFIVIMIFITA